MRRSATVLTLYFVCFCGSSMFGFHGHHSATSLAHLHAALSAAADHRADVPESLLEHVLENGALFFKKSASELFVAPIAFSDLTPYRFTSLPMTPPVAGPTFRSSPTYDTRAPPFA
ncbi:MAG: hypothetical protein KDK37_03285 [Leptospiraceae bacterium]|nr:hypothetical protein [Leptospiraceae bacterium]